MTSQPDSWVRLVWYWYVPTHLSGAFEAHPIIKISSNLRIKAKVVKAQPKNSKMLVLKTRSTCQASRSGGENDTGAAGSAAVLLASNATVESWAAADIDKHKMAPHNIINLLIGDPFRIPRYDCNLFIFTSEFQRVHPI